MAGGFEQEFLDVAFAPSGFCKHFGLRGTQHDEDLPQVDQVIASGRGRYRGDGPVQNLRASARIQHIVGTFAFVDCHRSGFRPVQVGMQRLPGIVLVALGETVSEFGGRAEDAKIGLAGNGEAARTPRSP